MHQYEWYTKFTKINSRLFNEINIKGDGIVVIEKGDKTVEIGN